MTTSGPANSRTIKASDLDTRFLYDVPDQKRKRGKQKAKKRIYKDLICAFDIETTNIPEIQQSVMYIWQMQIGEDRTIIGRTWKEWLDLLEDMARRLRKNEYIVCYIFNAAFEFQFIRGVYAFDHTEIFAMDNRDVLTFTMFDHFEFRCAYHFTNMSLRAFLKQMNVADQKTELDYSVQRWPWTPLSEEEMTYCINDVKGLVEALKKRLEMDGDSLYTTPLTSTGFVRRDIVRAMEGFNREQIHEMIPPFEVYQILRDAFRGGNTHGSRFLSDCVLEGVRSYDRVSSYPDVMINRKYPLKPWVREKRRTPRRLQQMLKRNVPFLLVCALTNVRLKDELEDCPYLARDKCRRIKDGYYDNGRILSCEYCETSCTSLDWEIILDQYLFDEIYIIDLWSSSYRMLPEPFRETIIKYYERKTALKGAETEEDIYMYNRSKERVNAAYGLTVTDPVRQAVLFDDEIGFHLDEKDPLKLYEKYRKKTVFPYSVGVWVAAWGRWELHQMMKIVKKQGGEFVYTDTDSVKFIGDVDFSEYNREHEERSRKNGGTAKDRKGVEHPLGVLELDGIYDRFKFLRAKCYAYEEKGKLHITIAGVNKKDGAVELAEKGGLNALGDRFTFERSGKTCSTYNDVPFGEYDTGEGIVDITPNVYIAPEEYTVKLTPDYVELVLDAKKLKYNTLEFLKGI